MVLLCIFSVGTGVSCPPSLPSGPLFENNIHNDNPQFLPSHSFAYEQKYEEKRQRYLAMKSATSTSEKPRVRFGQEQVQNAVVSGPSLPSGAEEDPSCATPRRPNHQHRDVPRDPPPNDRHKFRANVPYDTEDVNEREELQERDFSRRRSPTAARIVSTPDRRRPTKEEVDDQSPAVTANPKAEYARQLREQTAADAATVERARDDARRPVVPAPVVASSCQGLANLPGIGGNRIRRGGRGGGGGGDGAAGVGGGETTIDRKAEYALQLREQMVADEVARRAAENERKRATLDSGGRGVGGNEVESVGSAADAKAEYARQLREQISIKENARRKEEGRREHSSFSTDNGPAWIEGATEGRQEHRKKSNAEYAEQLRAQIAAQRSGVEKSRMALRARMHENDHHSMDAEEQQHRQQRQRPRVTNSGELRSRGPERHKSRSNQEDSVGGEADYSLGGGQRAVSPQGGAQSSSARER